MSERLNVALRVPIRDPTDFERPYHKRRSIIEQSRTHYRSPEYAPELPPEIPVLRIPSFVRFSAVAILAAGTLSAQTKPATKVAAPKADAGWSASVKPVWPDEGPYKWAPRPTGTEITANDLRTRLYGFADDSMLGRRIGELTNFRGTAYIAAEFKRLGLKPAGEVGGYYQNMPFGPFGFDSTGAKLSVGGTPLAKTTDWIPMAPAPNSGISAKADYTNAAAVFAGKWGDTTVTLDPAMFRGKVAVFLAAPAAAPRPAAQLTRCDSLPDRFGAAAIIIAADAAAAAARSGGAGAAPAAGGGRAGGFGGGARDGRALAAGAVGVLVIGLDDLTAATISAAFAMRGAMQPATINTTGIGGATISRAAAAKIFGKPATQLAVGDAGAALSANYAQTWTMSTTPARNVIAMLPGSDPARAAEYVLVGAHNDHVGTTANIVDHDSLRAVNTVTRRQGSNDPVCRPTVEQQHRIDSLIARARSIRAPRRDSIMNGADDDGSGTVVLLEIAEKFAKEKPARSIVFISHQGEESGLLGSAWFANHPTVPLKNIVAAHNMDMVGKGRAEQVKFGGPASVQMLGARRLSREFGDVIDSVNANRTEVMALDKSWDVTANPMNRFCRSDQVNYVLKDVPVTYFSLGYAQDYHMPTDEPQYIDYEHAARLGRFIHDVMTAIANRNDRLAISGNDPTMPRCR